MMRLLRSELARGWASWVGIVAVAAVASLSFGIAVSFLETGLREGGEFLEGSTSFLAALLMFSLPSGVIVISAVARLAVELNLATYARWQLAGVGPAQTASVVVAQLAASGFVGAIAGFAATTYVAPRFIRAVFAEDSSETWSAVHYFAGPLTAAIIIPLTVAVTIAGGARAARAAARTPALFALREPEVQGKRMRWWRWVVLAIVTFTAAMGVIAPLQADARSTAISQLPMLPVFLMIPLAAAAPVLYPLVLRSWTALVPAKASTSWYLARHQARYHLSRSTASITPLFVGASLLGGLMTMAATTGASMDAGGLGGNFSLSIMKVLLLAGGPVLLGTVGAAVVIFMSNQTQGAEQALLHAGGATTGTVLCSALWQAVIHVVTACILAGAVIVATGAIAAAALSRFVPPVLVVDASAGLALAGMGLLLTVLATVSPVIARSRESVTARLAAI